MGKSARHNNKPYSHEVLMRYAKLLGFGEIHYHFEPQFNLQTIIAIHNTSLGPAIGGCRFYPYQTYSHALKDVLRLASMMTVKNAACHLPHGGAKAIIISPKKKFDRKLLFNAFGNFVNSLNGRYITAMDVGTSNQDMDYIAECTPYVIGSTRTDILQEDPSPYTAKGVLRGIQAAVKFKLQCDSLENIVVAIQGAGKVGQELSKLLAHLGAKIIISDTDPLKAQKVADETRGKMVTPDEIARVACHVFSPCALGGVLTLDTISTLRCQIVAGSANNQLSHRLVGHVMHDRGILYAPDFIINAGGVIQAASIYDYHDINIANQKIDKLYDQLYHLFERAKQQQLPTITVAYQIADEYLKHSNQHHWEKA